MRLPAIVGLLGLALVGTGRTAAHAADGDVPFVESDRNRDGSVDRREMERRTLEVFSFADNDKDAYLSRAEYDSLVGEVPFATADADRDGRVSTHEFVALRMREFEAADRNRDGVLSPADVSPTD